VILVLFLTLFAALSHYYSTTTYEYAWVLSACFISDVTPVVLLMLALLVLQGVVCACFARYRALCSTSTASINTPKSSMDSAAADRDAYYSDLIDRIFIYAFFISVNLFFVAGANAAYVYGTGAAICFCSRS